MLVLPAELTHRQAAACLGMLQQGLRAVAGPAVVVDATALTVLDSSALAVILACRRACQTDGKTFTITGLDARLQGLSVLYGVDSLLVPASAPRAAER